MTNHPSRRKLSILDLASQTIPANDCRRRLRVGGFDVSHLLAVRNWGAGWFLDKDNIVQVGLTYQDAICARSSVGLRCEVDGFVCLSDRDDAHICSERGGSPEELRSRASRERRLRHDTFLWRLEKAQESVTEVADVDGADLVAIATSAFCS